MALQEGGECRGGPQQDTRLWNRFAILHRVVLASIYNFNFRLRPKQVPKQVQSRPSLLYLSRKTSFARPAERTFARSRQKFRFHYNGRNRFSFNGLTIDESCMKAPMVITCRVTSRVFSSSSGVAYSPSLRKYGSLQVNLQENEKAQITISGPLVRRVSS